MLLPTCSTTTLVDGPNDIAQLLQARRSMLQPYTMFQPKCAQINCPQPLNHSPTVAAFHSPSRVGVPKTNGPRKETATSAGLRSPGSSANGHRCRRVLGRAEAAQNAALVRRPLILVSMYVSCKEFQCPRFQALFFSTKWGMDDVNHARGVGCFCKAPSGIQTC